MLTGFLGDQLQTNIRFSHVRSVGCNVGAHVTSWKRTGTSLTHMLHCKDNGGRCSKSSATTYALASTKTLRSLVFLKALGSQLDPHVPLHHLEQAVACVQLWALAYEVLEDLGVGLQAGQRGRCCTRLEAAWCMLISC